jgi:hypothetical protein
MLQQKKAAKSSTYWRIPRQVPVAVQALED